MKELVGSCTKCGKDVFCLDGFLNGFKDKIGNLICFDCDEDHVERKEKAVIRLLKSTCIQFLDLTYFQHSINK